MTYFVNILDEQGHVELIDGELAFLYPHLDFKKLVELSEESYLDYVAKSAMNPRFIDGKFVIETVTINEQAVISAEKSAKLSEINHKAQEFVNQLAHLDDTPEFERETWPIQREEAKAWFTDRNAKTPIIALIAQTRGVPLDVLRQKAYEKAKAYQTVAAVVAGQRQAYEDRLNRAETLEQIRAIEPSYQLPQQGGSDE